MFPFKRCMLSAGTVLSLKNAPTDHGSFYKLTLNKLDFILDGAPSALDDEKTPVLGSDFTVDASDSKDEDEDSSGYWDEPDEDYGSSDSKSGSSLDDLLNEIASGGKTYLAQPSFNLTSTPNCTSADTFLTSSILQIQKDALEDASPAAVVDTSSGSSDSGVSRDPSSGGYVFPLAQMPYNDWFTGAAAFGSYRSGGRIHAASDLYTPAGRTVRSIANGKVLDYYYFYSGTNALVVEHDDGRVVRYGEVSGVSFL